MSAADLDSWGWRIPFFVGAALAGVGVDRALDDARKPEFERQRQQARVPESRCATRSTNHRAGIARGFSISALGSITYYVGITYVPAFLTSAGSLPRARGAVAVDHRRGGGDPRHAADRRC